MKNNLKKLRIKHGFNQRQLAEACHTPQSLISDIERGTKTPWPAFINRVCGVLEVDIQDAFPGYMVNKKESTAVSLTAPAALSDDYMIGGDPNHAS